MTEFKKSVLESIKEDDVTPKPKHWFVLGHIVLWLVCLLTVFIGGVAFGMLLFEFLGTDKELMRLARWQHANQKFLSILPYVWIALTVLTVTVSSYFFRSTSRGYRHRPSWIVLGILLSSVIVGSVLFAFRGPHMMDALFQKHPRYEQVRQGFRDRILDPKQGRIGGILIDETRVRNHLGDTYEITFSCETRPCERYAQDRPQNAPAVFIGELDDEIFEVRDVRIPKKDDIRKVLDRPGKGRMPMQERKR